MEKATVFVEEEGEFPLLSVAACSKEVDKLVEEGDDK